MPNTPAWDASWRSFFYFNLYRLIVALLLLGAALMAPSWLPHLSQGIRSVFSWISACYVLFLVLGTAISLRWRHRFNLQLTAGMFGDALFLGAAASLLGGMSSGVGLLLLVSLAAASLVGRGRLVLFYAAMATIAVLFVQALQVLQGDAEAASLVQAAILCLGYFATAVLARLLGKRVMENEELARLRGEALERQIRVGERIIERM